MVDELLHQLDSPDAGRRKQAITELARLHDLAAVPALTDLYHHDPVPEVRELAFRAIKHIRELEGDPRPPPAARQSPPAPPPPKVTVSTDRAKRAHTYLQDAMSSSLSGDSPRAIKSLNRALSLNPLLVEDQYFMSVAGIVMGMEPREAVLRLRDSAQRSEAVKSASRERRAALSDAHMQAVKKVGWRAVLFDLLVYALISLLGPVVVLVVFAQAAESLRTLTITVDQDIQQAVSISSQMNAGALVTVAIVSMLASLASLFILCGVIHLCARLLLRGVGTFRYLLDQVIAVLNPYLLLAYLAASITVWIAIGQAFFPILLTYAILLPLYSLYTFGIIGFRTGAAYRFNRPTGCLTVFTAALLIAFVNVLLGAASAQGVSSLVSRLFPSL